MGIIHSHVNMGVFFSGTDTSTLHEYAKLSNYCISIIVNNKGDIIGKAAFPCVTKVVTSAPSYKNHNGEWVNIKTGKSETENITIKEVELDVVFNIDDNFIKNTEHIISSSYRNDYTKKGNITNDGEYKKSYTPHTHITSQYKKDEKNNFICKCLLLDEDSEITNVEQCLNHIKKELTNLDFVMYQSFIQDNIESYYKTATSKSFVVSSYILPFLKECLVILRDYTQDSKFNEIAEIVYDAISDYIESEENIKWY